MERQRATSERLGRRANAPASRERGRRPAPRARLTGGDRQQGGTPAAIGHAGRSRLGLASTGRRAQALLMAVILVLTQAIGPFATATPAAARDMGTLTVTGGGSFADYDDINSSYSGMHFFEVDTANGIAYCGSKNRPAPETGAAYTGGFVSGNAALDWVLYHGWSPDNQTGYGLSSSRFRFLTQYMVWLAMPNSEINDHSWARLEISKTYSNVRAAVEQMEAEMNAYVEAGGGGPEAGCSVIWPSEGDALQSMVTFRNPQVEVVLHKSSDNAELTFGNAAYSLAGAVYEIRRCGDDELVATVTTDADGSATCDLAPNVRYYARETVAPRGYQLAGRTVEFTASADGQVVELTDSPTQAEIRVQKADSSTGGEAQAGTTLAGAELRLVDARGKVHVATTDEQGWVRFGNLPLGTATVTEVRAPKGYRASEKPVQVSVTADQVGTDGVARIEMASAISEDAIAFDLEIAKFKDYGQEGSGLEQPAAGVRFQVISNTTGSVVGELVTNEYGFADTSAKKDLWFGAGSRAAGVRGAIPFDAAGYTVHEVESTVPGGFSHVGDWTISADQMADGAKLQYIADNHALSTRLQVVKQDAASGQTAALAGFTFQVLDADRQPVTQESWYPNHVTLSSFTTDESGCVTLPQPLVPGTYYIREVSARAPYLIANEDVRFDVPADATLSPVVVVRFADEQATGAARITKRSENGTALAAAEFDVVAQELVKSPDGTIQATEGQVMGHVATDENGEASIEGLPLGSGSAHYAFVETTAPVGYVLDPTPIEFTLSWQDQETSAVWAEVDANNALATGTASVEKRDARNASLLAGAEFDVIAQEKIVSYDGAVTHEEGDVVAHVTTAENGIATTDNLTLARGGARYAFVETKAPEGYLLDATPHEFTLAYEDQMTPVVLVHTDVTNDFTKVEFSKVDEKGELLAGASLVLLDANGEVVDTWETSGDPHGIAHLAPGTYTLVEKEAPEGYLKADPITFAVEETPELQEVTMTDLHVPTPEQLPSTGEPLPIRGFIIGIIGGCSIMGYLLVKRRN